MRQGLEYLKGLQVVTNRRIARELNNCSKSNGGCDGCPDKQECQDIYDMRFTEFAVYKAIELKKEHDVILGLGTMGYASARSKKS